MKRILNEIWKFLITFVKLQFSDFFPFRNFLPSKIFFLKNFLPYRIFFFKDFFFPEFTSFQNFYFTTIRFLSYFLNPLFIEKEIKIQCLFNALRR